MFKNSVIVYSFCLGRRADNWNVKMQMYLDILYQCKKELHSKMRHQLSPDDWQHRKKNKWGETIHESFISQAGRWLDDKAFWNETLHFHHFPNTWKGDQRVMEQNTWWCRFQPNYICVRRMKEDVSVDAPAFKTAIFWLWLTLVNFDKQMFTQMSMIILFCVGGPRTFSLHFWPHRRIFCSWSWGSESESRFVI